jgi:ubiquinone/menaquinone biosynthesis C-methylase UbiE
LLSGNGAIHSNIAYRDFQFKPGDKVLDIGSGDGETCLDIGKFVTSSGEVLGLDCTESFLEIANNERDQSGLKHVKFELGDVQIHELPLNYFDVVFSRFGVMFFQSIVMALRNAHKALKPRGRLCLIVWRTINDNPCWNAAKQIALKHLPPPGEDAKTCGPGPFSMADEETDRAILKAAGFEEIELFKRIDADVCMGINVEEAIDYQILVGPSGEIIREAGEEGKNKLPVIRQELETLMRGNLRDDGVYMPSSTWAIMVRK